MKCLPGDWILRILGSLRDRFFVTFKGPEAFLGFHIGDSEPPFWKPGRVQRVDFEGLGLTFGSIFDDFNFFQTFRLISESKIWCQVGSILDLVWF